MTKRIPPFVHPKTHTLLKYENDAYICPLSGDRFPLLKGTIPAFASSQEWKSAGIENALKKVLRRFPKLYRFLILTISPACPVGLSARAFLRTYVKGANVLNVGSGVHRYRNTMVNLDIHPFKGVDVVGDTHALPFGDGSFDAVISECLLEHIPDPMRAVQEYLRVLRPGGFAYVVAPFSYPYHSCPDDYFRWSVSGLRTLFRDWNIVRIAPRSGPASALTAQLIATLSVLLSCGSERLYTLWFLLLQCLLFPLKLFDIVLGHIPTAVFAASALYVVAQKPNGEQAEE